MSGASGSESIDRGQDITSQAMAFGDSGYDATIGSNQSTISAVCLMVTRSGAIVNTQDSNRLVGRCDPGTSGAVLEIMPNGFITMPDGKIVGHIMGWLGGDVTSLVDPYDGSPLNNNDTSLTYSNEFGVTTTVAVASIGQWAATYPNGHDPADFEGA